jgi:flagellar biosynthesis regulator FlaF
MSARGAVVYTGRPRDGRQLTWATKQARIAGIELEEFIRRRDNGEHYCVGCRTWFPATRDYFGPDKTRWRGLDGKCKQCRAAAVRVRRRVAAGAPLDAPPRSGRRPYSNTYSANWQRDRISEMTPEQRASHYASMRSYQSARYHQKGWDKVRAERAARSEQQHREKYQQLMQMVRATQAVPIDHRTVEESALLFRAWWCRLIDDCDYHPQRRDREAGTT